MKLLYNKFCNLSLNFAGVHLFTRTAIALMFVTPLLAAIESRAGSSFEAVWFPHGNIEWYAETTPGPHPYLTDDQVEDVIVPTMHYMSERLPLKITRTYAAAYGRLIFMKSSMDSINPSNAWTNGYWNPAGNPKDIAYFKNASVRASTTAHEFGHALGMPHEHQRADAQQRNLVTVAPICTADVFNYGPVPGTVWGNNSQYLSPFDPISRMLYRSSNGCVTLTATGQPAALPTYPRTGTTFALYSPHDINSIYRLYGRSLGIPQDHEKFGHAMAVADFDDDGFEDIAVAANELITVDTRQLSLFFFRGVAQDPSEPGAGRRYMPWFAHLVRSDIPNNITTQAYRLALAAGDFNGDGRNELAVGYPENVGERRVRIYAQALPTAVPSDPFPTSSGGMIINEYREPFGVKGLRILQEIRPVDINSSYLGRDTFAASLRAAHLTTRDRADLAIGWPTARTIAPQLNGAGVVVHVSTTNSSKTPLDPATRAIIPNPAPRLLGPVGGPFPPNPDFGLAIGVIPTQQLRLLSTPQPRLDRLAIGAPGESSNRGRVYIYSGSASASSQPTAPSVLATLNGEPGSRFGQALEGIFVPSAEFSGRHVPNSAIVVGAPDEEVGINNQTGRSGAVHLYGLSTPQDRLPGATGPNSWFLGKVISPGSYWAQRMKWGASLAVVRNGPNFDDVRVAIGSPGAKNSRGAVYAWRPFTARGAFSEQGTTLEQPSGAGRFGEALSAVAFDTARPAGETRRGFAIGSPTGKTGNANSGFVEITVFHEDERGSALKPDRQTLDQNTTGDRLPK